LIISSQQISKQKQDGIALLVLVIALALTISAYYFSNISITKIKADKLQETQLALKQAKQQLLAYAAIRAEMSDPTPQAGRYGYLPCPASTSLAADTGEGNSVGTCEVKHANSLGWFPWRSLGVDALKDGNGSCLLYAVSGDYKVAPSTDMLNEDSNGMFQVVDEMGVPLPGNTAKDRVAAIIFSAGDALTGQDRNYLDDTQCGHDIDNFSAYLESLEVSPGDVVDNSSLATGIADEVYRIVQAATATNKSVINDQFITISRDELWSAITARNDFIVKMSNLTEAMAICLSKYAAANAENRLPWPAPMNLADYRLDDNYDDAIPDPVVGLGYAGRFPFKVTDSNARIGIVGADVLFTGAVCNNLVLPPDTITVDGEILARGGITVDLLGGASDEYENLWKNWKDHFFYMVSQGYEPVAPPAPPAPPVSASCGNCITVDGTNRAATVIFAGSSMDQPRNGPPDIDTKQLIANYLENGNETIFPDITGNGTYVTGGNDIMFCIGTGLGVVPC